MIMYLMPSASLVNETSMKEINETTFSLKKEIKNKIKPSSLISLKYSFKTNFKTEKKTLTLDWVLTKKS